jgi:hypothetical protein
VHGEETGAPPSKLKRPDRLVQKPSEVALLGRKRAAAESPQAVCFGLDRALDHYAASVVEQHEALCVLPAAALDQESDLAPACVVEQNDGVACAGQRRREFAASSVGHDHAVPLRVGQRIVGDRDRVVRHQGAVGGEDQNADHPEDIETVR